MLLPAAALALLTAAPARAATLGFDLRPDLSDAAAASFRGVTLSSAQVLSEASVALLLGYDADGVWATSGDQGIVNSLGPVVAFRFADPVPSFSIDVLGVEKDGVTLPIALFGYVDDVLVATAVSDPLEIGDSGLHEARLSLDGAEFTSIELGAVVECEPAVYCFSNQSTTFFADTATFVPEPGASALGVVALLAIALVARGRRESP